MFIQYLTNSFFILFIINFFITFYSIYTFFEVYVFQNLQGYKLNKKQKSWKIKWFILKKYYLFFLLL